MSGGSSLSFSSLETPIGWIYVVSDGVFVTEIAFERPPYPEGQAGGAVARQLKEYFDGERFVFDIGINYGRFSMFYSVVYKALREIPYGVTCSYKELAERAGSPSAARAVGQAMSHNPIPIILPCHRVIASDGSLGGYSGGVAIKEKLLALEKQYVNARKDTEIWTRNH
ncbi:MAG: methylated-DNA--[protein]-cysteine S-methyltransferase [Nitrospirae bacterium]|nr:methylated-DNA--[protein]-cysteine S-methyltransferase [Nitrospirota bacterium]